MRRARSIWPVGLFVTAIACTGGAAPTASLPTPAPSSVHTSVDRWRGTMRSTTYHDLYVGGRCTTRWNTSLLFTVGDGGKVSGHGKAKLAARPTCDFPVSQLPIRSMALKINGLLTKDRFELTLSETSQSPATGAIDLGGFLMTLLGDGHRSGFTVPVRGTRAESTVRVTKAGPDRDTFVSINRISLSCTNCSNA